MYQQYDNVPYECILDRSNLLPFSEDNELREGAFRFEDVPLKEMFGSYKESIPEVVVNSLPDGAPIFEDTFTETVVDALINNKCGQCPLLGSVCEPLVTMKMMEDLYFIIPDPADPEENDEEY